MEVTKVSEDLLSVCLSDDFPFENEENLSKFLLNRSVISND